MKGILKLHNRKDVFVLRKAIGEKVSLKHTIDGKYILWPSEVGPVLSFLVKSGIDFTFIHKWRA